MDISLKGEIQMKKILVVLIVVVMVLAIAAPAFAHPPHAEDFGNKANVNAKDGLHRACGAVGEKPVASHVLLNWVGPGPH